MTEAQRDFFLQLLVAELIKRGRDNTLGSWVLAICLGETSGRAVLTDLAGAATAQAEANVGALEAQKLTAEKSLKDYSSLGKSAIGELEKSSQLKK